MRFHIKTSTHGPVTRYYVIDSHDGYAVTWSDNRDHAIEWRDLYNEESASPPHMYGEYCECEECTGERHERETHEAIERRRIDNQLRA